CRHSTRGGWPSVGSCARALQAGANPRSARGVIVCAGHSLDPPMPRLLALVLAAAVVPAAFAADRITGEPFATRSEVHAPHAMAATSHPLATQVALDVMKAGGSAVDAAIAAKAALGLMEPTGNGIGGYLFAIVWEHATRRLYGYNGSGRSPR